jgi:hypothetical protein
MIDTLAIPITLGFIVMSAIVDSEHILKREYIDSHKSRWTLRLFFFLAMGISNWVWFFASGLLFAALFDQTLNYYRGKSILYLGTVSKWDIFFKKHKLFYVIVKILSLLVSLFLFTHFMNK